MAVTEELRILIKAEADKAVRNLKKFDKEISQTEKSMRQMGKVAQMAGGMVLGAFSARKIFDIGKAMVQSAADIETAAASFEVLLGSADAAADIMDDIQKFSASTPFQFEELQGAAKRMLAFGTASGDVVEKLEQLGNLGQGNSQVLDRLTNAYGKVQAKGRASLEELNMFTEAGVPIMKELARQYDVTSGEMFKLIEGGKVGFAEIDAAVVALSTGTGQFAGMLQKQSETLNGMMSTLQDNIKRLGAELGQSVLPGTKTWVGLLNKGLMLFNDSRAAQRTYHALLEKSNTEQLTFQEEIRKLEAQRNWYAAAREQMDEDQLIRLLKGRKYYRGLVDEIENINEQLQFMERYQATGAKYADEALIARREEAMLLGEESDALFALTEEEEARLKHVKEIFLKHQAITAEMEAQAAIATEKYYSEGLEEMKGIIEDDMSELERLEAQFKRLSALEWKPDQIYQVEIREEALEILEREIEALKAQGDELDQVEDSHKEIVNYLIAAQEQERLGGKSLRAQNAAAKKRVQLAAAAAGEEARITAELEKQAQYMETAEGTLDEIVGAAESVSAALEDGVFETKDLVDIIADIAPAFGPAGAIIGVLFKAMSKLSEVLDDLQEWWNRVVLGIDETKDALEEMESGFKDTGEGFGEMVDGMMHDLDDVLQAIGQTYDEELWLLQHLLEEGMINVEEYLRRLDELQDWKATETAGGGGGGGSTNIISSGGSPPSLPAAITAPTTGGLAPITGGLFPTTVPGAGGPSYSYAITVVGAGTDEETAKTVLKEIQTLDRRRRL